MSHKHEVQPVAGGGGGMCVLHSVIQALRGMEALLSSKQAVSGLALGIDIKCTGGEIESMETCMVL